MHVSKSVNVYDFLEKQDSKIFYKIFKLSTTFSHNYNASCQTI